MTDLDQALARLHTEYEADSETFLTRLRIDLIWDEAAFAKLTDAMRVCCRLLQNEETIPKWVAELFWFTPTFARSWTSHDAWNVILASNPDYYQSCYKVLDELAEWFFTGAPR